MDYSNNNFLYLIVLMFLAFIFLRGIFIYIGFEHFESELFSNFERYEGGG